MLLISAGRAMVAPARSSFKQDLDGVEPVEGFGGGAVGYAFTVVAFAEVP
jgi:hypothetical protein